MARFHIADYCVFVASLVVSMGTGVYFAVKGRREASVEQFLLAGKDMHVLPVAISLFVSWTSAISFIADPVEVYKYGMIYVGLVLGYCLGALAAAYFAPMLHKLNVVSCYEFIEVRYNKGFRLGCCIGSMIVTSMWMGIAIYAPALALSQSSGIPVWLSIVLIGTVCTFYTTIGGMKAVLWADTLQMVIMLAGQVAILVRGAMHVGGFTRIYQIAMQGGRLHFDMSNVNPLSGASFWVYFVGGAFRVFCPYISAQMQVQRYATLRTPQRAALAVLLNVPMYLIVFTMLALNGLIMFVMYHDCDPLLAGRIERRDQMVPLIVLDLLSFLPGIPGLFLATIFSASLSSLSSGINALSANALCDLIEPLYLRIKGTRLPAGPASIIVKLLVVLFGFLTTLIAFLPGFVGRSIFSLCILSLSIVTGPTCGLFLMGLVFPQIRGLFVEISFAIGITCTASLGIMAFVKPLREPWEQLPFDISGCDGNLTQSAHSLNMTVSGTHDLSSHASPFTFADIHHLNVLLYNVLGTVIVTGVSLTLHIISCCYNCRTNTPTYASAPVSDEMSNGYMPSPQTSLKKRTTTRNHSLHDMRCVNGSAAARLSQHSTPLI